MNKEVLLKEEKVKEIEEENKEMKVILCVSEKDVQRTIIKRDKSKRDRKYGR